MNRMFRFFTICLFSLVFPALSNSQPVEASAVSARIFQFDVLGIKLGMSEKEARAKVINYIPGGGMINSGGKKLNAVTKDYFLKNPSSKSEVRSGFKIGIEGAAIEYDFLIVLVVKDKVWAISRYDMTGRYDFQSTYDALLKKYEGTNPKSGNGTTVLTLSDGPCEGMLLVSHTNGRDQISLPGSCNTSFTAMYQANEANGVKTLSYGRTNLVDLNLGRAFFADMRDSGKLDAEKAQKSLSTGKL